MFKFGVAAVLLAVGAEAQGEVFEAEHSVQAPFFGDGTFDIPHWEFFGNTVVSDESIRLTPDRQTKRGALWNKKPWTQNGFQMTVQFSVNGQGKSLFGDGFALWYTKGHGSLGSALGNNEIFDGVGIFFDTYDNHQEDHGHPWVSALLNNGDKAYDHDEDGKSVTTGGCQSFFRNLDHDTYARVIYYHGLSTLKVDMQIKENGEWDECFVVRDVFLPSGHYFGATASTGDLADNHDIVSIKVSAAPAPTEEFLKKTEEYKKANPITSQNVAKRMQEEQKHHMDSNRIQSNHHAASAAEPEEGGVMIYIVIIVVAAGIGAAVYFTQIKKTEDARRFSF